MKTTDNYSEEDVFNEVKKESAKITGKDVESLIRKEKRVEDKADSLNLGKFSKLFNQIKLSFSLIKDYRSKAYMQVPWKTVAFLVAAVLYFVNPFDIIPDLLPVIGFTDDALAFAAVFKAMQSDLKKYCTWKGYNPELYF